MATRWAATALLVLCMTTLVGCYEALEADGDIYVFSRLDGSVCRFEKASPKFDIDTSAFNAELLERLMRDGVPMGWQTDSVTCLDRVDLESEFIPSEEPE